MGNMFDGKLIAAHQSVVDKSGRPPNWWGEHLAWAYLVFGFIGNFLAKGEDVPIWRLGLLLLAGGTMLYTTRSQTLFTQIGVSVFFRGLLCANLGLNIAVFLANATNWQAAYMLGSALLVSYLYFTACKPPRPRKRNESRADGKDGST